MADILDEVLNDEKDEKRLILFRKLLPIIVVITIITAICIASYTWYNNKNIEHNRKIGDMFIELTSGDYNEEAMLDFINTSDNKQAELAEIKVASKLIQANNPVAAMDKLESIINNKKYDDITTSFARLLWIGLVLDQDKLSEKSQMQSRNYLQYFANEDQPFFLVATLMKAFFYKKNNQADLATEYARTVLNSKNASLILKEQARAVLSTI